MFLKAGEIRVSLAMCEFIQECIVYTDSIFRCLGRIVNRNLHLFG